MKNAVLFLCLIPLFFLTGCEKDDGVSDETVAEQQFEVTDYKINNLSPDEIYPIRNYTNPASGEEVIIYGKYDSDLDLERITQLVYQNQEDHLEFSFNANNNLTAITNYDLSSNTIKDQVLLKEEDSKFYMSQDNETQVLQKGEPVVVERFSSDVIGDKLYEVLVHNSEMLGHLNGTDGFQKKAAFKDQKMLVIPPVVVGLIAVVVVIKVIKEIGIGNITKNTDIESSNISDLLDKSCDEINRKSFSKSATAGNSRYYCKDTPEIKKLRKENSTLILNICSDGNLCTIELSGTWLLSIYNMGRLTSQYRIVFDSEGNSTSVTSKTKYSGWINLEEATAELRYVPGTPSKLIMNFYNRTPENYIFKVNNIDDSFFDGLFTNGYTLQREET